PSRPDQTGLTMHTPIPTILEGAPSFAPFAKGGLFRSNTGCPRHGVCAWVLGLPSPNLSSRPEQRRFPPLRSGGIVASSKQLHQSVIPNGVREVRYGFASRAFRAMNLSFSWFFRRTVSGSPTP